MIFDFSGKIWASRLSVLVTAGLAGIVLAGCNRSVNTVLDTRTSPQRLSAAPTVRVQNAGQLPPVNSGNNLSVANQGGYPQNEASGVAVTDSQMANARMARQTPIDATTPSMNASTMSAPAHNPAMSAPTTPQNSPQAAQQKIAAGKAATSEQSAEPITHDGVSGTWIVASDNADCRMILAYTKWSGGYRAATRRCRSAELQGVSAWDVKGKQLVLMDNGGNTIARLYNSGGERYDGTTDSGGGISFTR